MKKARSMPATDFPPIAAVQTLNVRGFGGLRKSWSVRRFGTQTTCHRARSTEPWTTRLRAAVAALAIATPGAVVADDYTWLKDYEPEDGWLLPVDPEACRLYEENLRYFARQNVPMSCERPIAPHLKDRIQAVEWEDLDPERYAALFRQILVRYQHLDKKPEAEILKSIDYAAKDVARRVKVFRRAKVELKGHIRTYVPSAPHEPYWIIQFGTFDISPENPDELWRCKPERGGPTRSYTNLQMYVADVGLSEIAKDFGELARPSMRHQHLRLIDGMLFVDNILSNGAITLNATEEKSAVNDTVCVFRFNRSKKEGN